ncbi:xanthine dehydrogenase family protein subunit M [Sulfolobus tengchongensis]|uniref:Xanthine dehydrogenase family protein subunit M n=1 Tax=Sulfolobus tengchongensis TaxID=207809 RepID=A0AAX4L1Z1_9CREN
MILDPFEYYAPISLDEAFDIASSIGGDFKFLAGGQTLIPMMKMNLIKVSSIIDLKKIRSLYFLEEDKGWIRIGSLVRHAEISESELIKKHLPILSYAAGKIAHQLVRNRGTIGGSISFGHYAADLCVVALLLNAKIEVIRKGSTRYVEADKFFIGPLTTDLRQDEIVKSISFKIPEEKYGWSFNKLVLSHGDFPLLITAVILKKDEDKKESGVITDIKIALGGVADTVVRAKEVEEFLIGKEVTEENVLKASKLASSIYNPSSTLEFSSNYMKRMVEVYLKRSIIQAYNRAQG